MEALGAMAVTEAMTEARVTTAALAAKAAAKAAATAEERGMVDTEVVTTARQDWPRALR